MNAFSDIDVLLEPDRQIIVYLNKIEAEQRLVEKIRRIKYLKDQLVWEQSTDVIWALQTHRPAFLEKRPRYNCLPSLEALTNTPDGIAALKEAHATLKNPTARRRTDPEPLTPAELSRGAVVKDTLNTFEVRSAFLGSSKDLMSFLRERGCSFWSIDPLFCGRKSLLSLRRHSHPLLSPGGGIRRRFPHHGPLQAVGRLHLSLNFCKMIKTKEIFELLSLRLPVAPRSSSSTST